MKMIGLARLGKDAEVRYTPGGDAVANLSLAYVCGRKKDSEHYAPSQWIDASLWGKQAEALAPYLVKGSVHCFYISDVHIETYEGRNGEGVKLVGRVDNVELGPRNPDQGRNDGGERPSSNSGSQRAQQPRQSAPADDENDDIPF
jgi:single-strand DNA-binding protein